VNEHVAYDLQREAELRALLEALERAAVPALLLKGAQLAYSVYARPDLRPRADTDLLITPDSRRDAERVLVSLGYSLPQHVTGTLVTHQATYIKHRGDQALHVVDLHWRVANPQVFSDLLSFDELSEASQPLPALGPAARAPSNAHALVLACVHRVAHHYDSECLIWLYDVHVLASVMSPEDWRVFAEVVRARRIVSVCLQSLRRATENFATRVPSLPFDSTADLDEPRYEVTSAYLAERRRVDRLVLDVASLESWSARWLLLREHLFPPGRYMREVYAPSSTMPLPVLYAWRVVRGARKWFKRPEG
jgi:hypothetical protein